MQSWVGTNNLVFCIDYNAPTVFRDLDGFTYGFKIPFQGERKYRIHENLISAKQSMKTLTDKITKEVLAGRVVGPFQSPPFTNIQISPLGLLPKKCP
jgi:hypothetical protein